MLPRLLPPSLSACVAALLCAALAAALPATDFVVVGGGTAGCTVTGKLCELLPSATITLVERGGKRDAAARFQSTSPRMIFPAWGNPNLTQAFPAAPDAALGNRSTVVLLGANLGGGSAINGGQLFLPPRGTFARWGIANLSDARAEALFAALRAAQPRTGVPSAPLTPSYAAQWLAAAQSAVLPFTSDPYEPPRVADASFDTHIAFDSVSGRRRHACGTFLRPARANACARRVRVIRGARAERVLFRRGRVARAVVLTLASGRKARVFARREVILAAGAVDSAALLLRSGVGPRTALRTAGVRRLVRDLPVGRALHTRGIVTVTSTYGAPLAPANDPAALAAPGARAALLDGKGGVYATSGFGPQARIRGVGYGGMSVALTPPGFGLPIILSYCLVDASPKSFGAVELAAGRGMTAGTPPVVKLRLLQRESDVDRAARCIQRMRRIHKQLVPLLNASENIPPGFTAEELDTRAGRVRFARGVMETSYHYVGTCAVGKVVDERLRVMKVDRLRVVDSAAIPLLPNTSGPMASVYVVALHAAELIAGDHKDLARTIQ